MIEATYIINENVKIALDAIASDDMLFYPGKIAPEEASDRFVLYNVSQGTDFNAYWLHSDLINYRVVHPNHETLQRMVSKLVSMFHVEDIENTVFVRQVGDPKVRFQATSIDVGQTGENYFSDQSKYFYVDASIIIVYTDVTEI